MKKRLLSILFTLALCLALLSVTALAADPVNYDVTVNDVAVTSDNKEDVLEDGKVSYDADTNTLTINGALTGGTNISGNGATNLVIYGGDSTAAYGLTVTDAQNVTVTANSGNPAITNNVSIACSGDVEITNEGSGQVVLGSLTVNHAQDVTVTANSGGAAISINGVGADITCSGDVSITNNGVGQAVGNTLFVRSAQNVKVTANSIFCAINNGADINCSGNVEITNNSFGLTSSAVQGTLTVNHAQDVTVTAKSGQAVSGTLTVNDAQNVKVTANLNGYAAINYVDITCSGDVEIVNQGGGRAVYATLTFQQSNGHSYTLKTGNDLESLDVYAEREAGETFEVESLDASAVKIESADHTPGEWEHNRTQHWQVCTACGAELDRADHTFSGRTCTVCGYTKPASTYTITLEPANNGDVTSSHKTASKGTTVTLTVVPDKGYTLETLTVTDGSGKEIELTNKGDGKYTFKMPGSKVTVKATFMEDNSMLNFFVDVFPGDYYYDAVLWAAENGITGGVDDTHFSPNAPCTRAQAVTFLWRAAGCPTPQSSEMPFTDVAEGSYYYDAVLWAVENGITKGTSDTTFDPDATCNRGQIVTFLWRSQNSPAVGSGNPFDDVKAEDYYADAVLWAVKEDVTNGTSDTTFSPADDCTRAQIVTFLYRT